MGIVCDVCAKNCTPKTIETMIDDDDDQAAQHSVIEIREVDFYVCEDCEEAIFNWIQSNECKEYCKKKVEE